MTSLIQVSPQGLHVPCHKEQTRHQPIQPFSPKKDLVFPLLDKRFGLIKPVVKQGEQVVKGQLIAAHDEIASLNIFASVSGDVLSIQRRSVLNQEDVPCLIIKPAKCITSERQFFESLDFVTDDFETLANRVAEAGIVGLGGAGFPSSLKLPQQENIKHLIINAAECEPFITSDERLMIERADELARALTLLKHWLKPEQITVAIEDDKPEAINALRAAVPTSLSDITVLKTQYPSGSERLLIQSITGERLEKGVLPIQLGVVCFNVATVYAMFEAITYGKPLLTRIVAVTGDKVENPGHFDVPIGTTVGELLESVNAQVNTEMTIVHGGLMMGQRFTGVETPVLKTTHCLVVDSQFQKAPATEKPCIRCGKCADVCPEMLLPQQLHWQSKDIDADKFDALRLMDCIECGACDYVCPSNIPLVSEFQASKQVLRKEQAEKQKSELSKQRFEERNERVEKRKIALSERRKQRATKEKTDGIKQAQQTEQVEVQASTVVDVAKLKAEAAKAESIYNQAKKALEQAKKMNAPKLEVLEAQVEKLKQHAEQTRQALSDAQA